MKKILFIAEKTILDSSICYSNDVNLLLESLKKNSAIYLAYPEDIILSCDKYIIKTNSISINDLDSIEQIKKESYLKSSLHMLFSLPISKKIKEDSIIKPFLFIKEANIKKSDIDIIIDRTEPVSRTVKYYDAILDLKDKKYFDDPIFRQTQSDKEIVIKIDQELKEKGQNHIGFKTKIIDFKEENKLITDKNRHKLYEILNNISENYQENDILNHFDNIKDQEKSSIISIIKKINNCQIDFDYFCIKPSNWYGGVAVELIGNKKNQIKANFVKKDLFYHIAKIHKNILEDVKKTNKNQDLILRRAILDGVIIQEQVCYPKFGDLRIFVSFGKIQGLMLRVPAKNNNIANMAAGGHAELFINPIGKNKQELDLLKNELKEIGYIDLFDAIIDLINNIKNSLKTKIGQNIKKSAFIGFDALLDKNIDKKYFSCNEINLSSAMGQNQIEIANLLEELLKNDHISLFKDKISSVKSPFAKFVLFKKLTENLSDEEKIKIITKLHSKIKNLDLNITSLSSNSIKDIIN